jgi:hypothetical protein
LLLAFDASGAAAIAARRLHNPTRASARLTRTSDREETLLVTNLACACAIVAVFRLCSWRRPVALTGLTRFQAGDTEIRGHSMESLFESDLKIVTQVGASLCCRTPPTLASTAKDIAKPKKVAQDIFDATKSRRAPALARSA